MFGTFPTPVILYL